MINCLFMLKEPNKDSTLLMVALRKGKEKVKISTGIKVNPGSWNQARQSFASSERILNEILLQWKAAIVKEIQKAELEGLGVADVKKAVVERMGKVNARETKSESLFLPYFLYWAVTTTTKRKATRQGLYSYRLFEEFCKVSGNHDVTFSEMSVGFIERFIEWMHSEKGLSANTRGGHVKNIKTVMNESYLKHLHDNTDYKLFRKEAEEVENVYLSTGELEMLRNVKLAGTKCKVRDLFLVGCHTAMRFSDYSRLSEDNVHDGFIHMIQQKTSSKVVMPVHPVVAEMLDKYGGTMPAISQQKFNSLIKDVCREAGITELETVMRNGKEVTVEKWELVSSHTARRTAATNMYKSGIPTISIMKITGHKTESSFMKYIKLGKEENAEILKDAAFFKE